MSALWPESYTFALALSHDVDRVAKRWQFPYYLAQAVIRRRPDQLWRHLQSLRALLRGDDPYWNFARLMALEDELGVRSTFFFLDEQGQASLFRPRSMVLFAGRYTLDESRIKRVIRALHSGGWEIGLHGSYHSYRDQALLVREKERLETILGEPVKGIRQHYLQLDIPETWQLQARAGFVYDSSLGLADRVGFRWGTSRPFFPEDPSSGSEIPVLQLPMAAMDGPLMQAESPWEEVLALIRFARRERGVLTINWHQRVFNPWEYQPHQEMYVQIIRECQEQGAWVAPLGTIVDWWQRQTPLKKGAVWTA